MTLESIIALAVAGGSALGWAVWPKSAAAAKPAGELGQAEVLGMLAKLRQHYAQKRLAEVASAQAESDLAFLEATFGREAETPKGA